MFSKNAYSSLLQQDSRASTNNSGLNGEILLTHHQDLLSSHYHHPVPDPTVLYSNQELGGHGHGLNAVTEPSSAPRTSTAKKDRHSKINTAQGPRDRRVRLSIGVARKFFDLQEMLGFDKPSKTLDWLLTKSKSAIKHMVQTKGSTTTKSVVSSLSECEENNNNDNSSNSRTKEKSVAPMPKKKKRAKVDAQHQEALSLAKESRLKARARARERTREKMCIKQQQQQQHRINETNDYDLIPIQYMNNQDYHQEDLIQESIVSKRRVVKHTSTTTTTNNNNPSIYGFQTSYGMPSSSYSNAAADNWDISNYATQSSICAILDQHKFNHS